jgi:hypothetical protein
MRNGHLVLAIAAILTSCFASSAKALEDCPLTAENYVCRAPCNSGPGKTCYHRTLPVLLKCKDLGSQTCAPAAKFDRLASVDKVNTAISCGIVEARALMEANKVDLSKVTLTEDLTFTLVSNSGLGGSVAFGIPVYPGVSVGPSLSELNSVANTSQVTNSFTIPKLDALKPNCEKINSHADWLNYVIVKPDEGQQRSRLAAGLEFYVSHTNNDSLSINIFALKIGPQFTNENDQTQKVCLTFDFEKPAVGTDAKPVVGPDGKPVEQADQQNLSKQSSASACQIGSSSGSQSKTIQ